MGVQQQFGRKLYFVGEVLYFTDYNVFTGALGVKIILKENMSLNFGVMPLALHDVRRNTTVLSRAVFPLISFRMLLHRH